MKVDLRGIFSGEVPILPVSLELDFAEVYDDSSKVPLSPVKFNGQFKNSADVVTLAGEVSILLSGSCDKCTADTVNEINIPVSHTLADRLQGEDDETFVLVEDMILDLSALIRDDVILDLPFLFLCGEDCKGICAGCGSDLNKSDCVCEREIDPRLAGLADFFDS